jgi:multiple sugar transport system permease protein
MVMLIVLAGLTTIPEEPIESALVDGASAFQRARLIIFPLLWPSIFTAVLLRLIDALKTFDILYSMTQGGPGYTTETINILAYRRAFEYFRMGEAACTLIVFFIIVLLISGLAIFLKSKTEVYN